MNKKTKHFVTFYYPGALVGESCTREIDKRDPRKALDYKASKGSYGFCFYSINYIDLDDGEYKSEKLEQTGTFFIDGELIKLEQIKKDFSGEYTLIANMEEYRWKEIIKTNVGWFLQFGENDQIINR